MSMDSIPKLKDLLIVFHGMLQPLQHGITFEEASTVFFDDRALLFDDPVHSIDEDRFLLLGMSETAKLCIVCHCYRESDSVIRIISARKATKTETRQYNEF